MSKHVLINHPGDGDWILDRAGGRFVAGYDHSLANHDAPKDIPGRILGGAVLNNYLGNAIMVHTAGDAPAWCSRDLLWMLFDYCFHQLAVDKVVAPVAVSNHRALTFALHLGFSVETKLRDVVAPGVDLLLLSITPAQCRWLKLRSTNYYSRVNHKAPEHG